MTEPARQAKTIVARGANLMGTGAAAYLRFARGYWRSPSGRTAWFLTGLILALLVLNLFVNVGLNRWQRWFFDMLERKEAGLLLTAVAALAVLIVIGAGFAVVMLYARMTLQIRWREWLTHELLAQWALREAVTDGRDIDGARHGSLEYRLVEDVRLAIDPLVDLAIGFINSVILGITFVGILVAVGGAIRLDILGSSVVVPGYLAIAAVLYALVLTTWMYRSGQPLIRRVGAKNEAESQFLFELTQAAEGNHKDATQALQERAFVKASTAFDDVVSKLTRVVREYTRLTWITNSHSFFSPILPLLLTAPKYLAGELSLGAVMQAAAAFTVVLGALNWLTDNYVRFAEWSASARRVDELRRKLFDDPA